MFSDRESTVRIPERKQQVRRRRSPLHKPSQVLYQRIRGSHTSSYRYSQSLNIPHKKVWLRAWLNALAAMTEIIVHTCSTNLRVLYESDVIIRE